MIRARIILLADAGLSNDLIAALLARLSANGASDLLLPNSLEAPHRGGRKARRWSFYIFSSGSCADELFFRDFDLEFFQEFGVFDHFLA